MERTRMGLTQAEFGALLEVSGAAVSAWEKGIGGISPMSLAKLSVATGKPAEYFLEDAPSDVQTPAGGLHFSSHAQRLRGIADELERSPLDFDQDLATTLLAPPPPYPGVEELLADEPLCRSLDITDGERELLRGGYALPVGPRTKTEAITLLQAIRQMTARR